MKAYISLTLILIFALGVASAWGQDSTDTEVREDIEQALEDFDPASPEFNHESLVSYLQDLADHPVNINKAGIQELLLVPGINLKTARAIVNYRSHNKPFEYVRELEAVPGIGRVTLEQILPYVTVGHGVDLQKLLFTDYRYWTDDGEAEIFSRYQQVLEPRKGYVDGENGGGYLGSPVKYYQRMKYRSDHLSVNLTQEKDPGEILTGPISFDHRSWHVALKDNGRLRRLVVGDYGLSFGQGLVLWNGGSFGKGREVIRSVNRNGRGIFPYSSAQETNYFRGVAATYGGDFQVSGFYSYRKRTASAIRGDTIRFPTESGYHRTAKERARKNNTRQELYGGRIRMKLPFGILGAAGYRTVFDKYIQSGEAVYNRHDFSGIYTSALSLDYTFLFGPALVFGEAARSQNGGNGFIMGAESSVGPDTYLTLAGRRYSRDFQSVLGDGFGEASGEPQNEEGVYLGVRHSAGDKVTFSAYIDQYRFPAPRFGTHQATAGFDWLGLVEVEFSNELQMYIQIRGEQEEDEYEEPDIFGRKRRILGYASRYSLRTHAAYWVNPRVRLRMRGEVVRSQPAGGTPEVGYLIYQDLRLIPSPRWKLDARITVFDTESYDSRIYQFENDLLYVFSNQVLYGRGQRLYLLINYEPFSFMEIWGKVGVTFYEDRQVIGSGLNEIRGDQKSDIGLQVRLRF